MSRPSFGDYGWRGAHPEFRDVGEEAPLGLWLRGHRKSAEAFGPSLVGAGNSFRCYEVDGRLLFPLNIPEQAARELVVQSLTAQVEGLAKLLRQGDPP
jgi:hypothetical protein